MAVSWGSETKILEFRSGKRLTAFYSVYYLLNYFYACGTEGIKGPQSSG